MQKLEIYMIESGLPMDGSYFLVGQDGVTKIVGHGDGGHYFYAVYKGENVISEWVNVPVKVTYFEPKANETTAPPSEAAAD